MAVRASAVLPKYQLPRRRRDTLRRERLHQHLADAFDYDVVAISAPAGYGKSTLAVDWADDSKLPAAWLSLDRIDRDPRTLLGDIVRAIRVAFPSALEEIAGHLEQGAGDAASLVVELVAAIQTEIDDLFLLVLDDVDAIVDAEPAVEVLDAFARSVPMNVRLYLLSRTWSPIPALPRLVGQRRAFTLTARDLHFNEEEAIAFLERTGVRDSARQSDLIRRADGWAAALAILADQYGASRADGPAAPTFILADFIDHEVLLRLPSDAVEVLQACAVLPSFDAALAGDLSGVASAASILGELERTNHLVTRVGDQQWFRIHSILRDHLLERMKRDEPERLRHLRRSAAALYARRGMRYDAVEMSLDAEDWSDAIAEIHELRDELYQRGEWTTLSGWLDRLPRDVLEDDPDLVMLRARLAIKVYDGQQGLLRLDALGDRPLSVEQRARRELYRSVAQRQVGRLPDAVTSCRRARAIALEELPDDAPLLVEIALEEAVALGMSGQFGAARERFEEAAAGFDRLGDHHRAAEAHDGLGITLYYQGWLADSMQHFTAAQRLWRALGESRAQLQTMNNIGAVQHMLGELETARDTFNSLVQRARDLRYPAHEAYGHEGLATVERDLGHLDNAISLYTLAIHEARDLDDPTLLANATSGLAMTYRERGEYAQARTLLEHGLRTSEQAGAALSQVWFRSGIGATLISERRFSEAIPVLEEAASQAAESGARREEALARTLLGCAAFHRRQRSRALEELRRAHSLVTELGYDQFLHAELRQMRDVVDYAAARRVGGEYFRELAYRLRLPSEVQEGPVTAIADTKAIRAEAFGTPRVVVAGRPISDREWRSERSKEMFFLLLHVSRPLRKEQIAVELWPDLPPDQINSAFHSTLYRLRRAIDREVVIQTDEGYRLNDDFRIEYDAREFEEHTRTADAEANGTSSEHLSAAVALYRGPFAETFESEWVETPRRDYESRYLGALLSLGHHALHRGDYAEATEMARAVQRVDPLHEESVRLEMRAYGRSGHLDRAAQAYRRLHRALRDELGQEPSRALQDEYERVISGAALDR